MKGQRGFTLLETMVALAILGISLAALMQAHSQSLSNAGRSRDLTVATLLARSKMIDVEKHLYHDGFQMSTEDEEGDFGHEGYTDVKWHYRISEVELDISSLTSLCGGADAKKAAAQAKSQSGGVEGADCESILTGVGSMIGSFTEELGRSLRVVDLKVTWPDGKFRSGIDLRALLSRDDFATEQEGDAARTLNQVTGGQPNQLLPGGAPAPAVQ